MVAKTAVQRVVCWVATKVDKLVAKKVVHSVENLVDPMVDLLD